MGDGRWEMGDGRRWEMEEDGRKMGVPTIYLTNHKITYNE